MIQRKFAGPKRHNPEPVSCNTMLFSKFEWFFLIIYSSFIPVCVTFTFFLLDFFRSFRSIFFYTIRNNHLEYHIINIYVSCTQLNQSMLTEYSYRIFKMTSRKINMHIHNMYAQTLSPPRSLSVARSRQHPAGLCKIIIIIIIFRSMGDRNEIRRWKCVFCGWLLFRQNIYQKSQSTLKPIAPCYCYKLAYSSS